MATKSQSLEFTIRNAKAVKGEILVTRCGAGLEMWVSINQSGKTLKKWVLRYTDATGKRQKVRIGSYPEMTLAKAQAAAEDLKEKAKTGNNLAKKNPEKSVLQKFREPLKAWLQRGSTKKARMG